MLEFLHCTESIVQYKLVKNNSSQARQESKHSCYGLSENISLCLRCANFTGFRIDGIKQADRDPDKNFKTVRTNQEVAYVLRKHIDYRDETRVSVTFKNINEASLLVQELQESCYWVYSYMTWIRSLSSTTCQRLFYSHGYIFNLIKLKVQCPNTCNFSVETFRTTKRDPIYSRKIKIFRIT